MKYIETLLIVSLACLYLQADSLEKPIWFDPTEQECTQFKGIMKDGFCDAAYYDAKKICKASNHTLPTIEVLEKTSVYCGAKPYNTYTQENSSHRYIVDKRESMANASYKECTEELGFDMLFSYMSLTKEPEWNWKKLRRDIIVHNFSSAYSKKSQYTFKKHVRCTK